MSPDSRGNFAIVLAAGEGRRFGGGKLVALWRGEPLIRWAVRTALAGPFEQVLVVTGHDGDTVEDALGGIDAERVILVRNPAWRDGLSRSLGCGLASLPPHAERVAIFLGDMPMVDPALAHMLLRALGAAPAALASCGRQPLHPVVAARSAFAALRQARGDHGARSLLTALPGVVRIEHDSPASAHDVDVPVDIVER